jgi:hypothetical protein
VGNHSPQRDFGAESAQHGIYGERHRQGILTAGKRPMEAQLGSLNADEDQALPWSFHGQQLDKANDVLHDLTMAAIDPNGRGSVLQDFLDEARARLVP